MCVYVYMCVCVRALDFYDIAIYFAFNTIGKKHSVPMWFKLSSCVIHEFKTMYSMSNKFNKCNNAAVLCVPWLSQQ